MPFNRLDRLPIKLFRYLNVVFRKSAILPSNRVYVYTPPLTYIDGPRGKQPQKATWPAARSSFEWNDI